MVHSVSLRLGARKNVFDDLTHTLVGERLGARKRIMDCKGRLCKTKDVSRIGARKAMPPSTIDIRHPGGTRKALSMPSGGGLYGSSADVMSACGGFGTDRYQCSTMNLPVSHSVRPHPLVSSKEIDTHYDGRTGLGPIMSSAFYDNKRFSACH